MLTQKMKYLSREQTLLYMIIVILLFLLMEIRSEVDFEVRNFLPYVVDVQS